MSGSVLTPRLRRGLAVGGVASLAAGVALLGRRAGRPDAPTADNSNWSPVERAEPTLPEARSMR